MSHEEEQAVSAKPGELAVADRLLDLVQTAQILDMSERKVYSMWQDTSLPSVLIGRNRRMRLSDLQEFIASLQPA